MCRERHVALKTVFIPIVTPTDPASDRLLALGCQPFESFSTSERGTGNDSLKPVYADLASAGKALESAVRAYACVSTLSLRPPRLAFYQRLFDRFIPFDQLRIVNLNGNRISEGQSADLGIALVLLMAAARTDTSSLIATGSIKPRPDMNDVEVLPVAAVPEKLRLLIHRRRNTAELDGVRWCFTPLLWEPTGSVAQPVRDLPEVMELKSLGINVEPIHFLSEAQVCIGASATRWTTQDRASIAGFLFLLGLLGLMGVDSAPIPMHFVPYGGDVSTAGPFIVCVEPDADRFRTHALKPLNPTVPAGGTLGWSVEVGNPESWVSQLESLWGDYFLAQVNVGEKSGIQVLNDPAGGEQAYQLKPGKRWSRHWLMGGMVESSILVLLAQRHRPFDAQMIAENFNRRFPANERGPSFLIEARNYLSSLAPGVLSRAYVLAESKLACEEQ